MTHEDFNLLGAMLQLHGTVKSTKLDALLKQRKLQKVKASCPVAEEQNLLCVCKIRASLMLCH